MVRRYKMKWLVRRYKMKWLVRRYKIKIVDTRIRGIKENVQDTRILQKNKKI